jgi:hypothetical protein
MEDSGKIKLGGQNIDKNISREIMEEEFLTPTEEIELPSKGVFYKNNKNTVKVKYLTTEEDNILFSPELIKSGKVFDALLSVAVIDNDITPDEMITGDRNSVLIYLRRTGLGDEYMPGKVTCPSCGEEYEPVIDLSKLNMKELDTLPDKNGEFDLFLPVIKKNIKFRMLTGADESRIQRASDTGVKKGKSKYKVSTGVTERYRLQIMEVEGNRDKSYISRFISAMPMKDSMLFREYAKLVSPGIDFNYNFECTKCGHLYEDDVMMTYRLFYPKADM